MADGAGHSIIIRQDVPEHATLAYQRELARLHEVLRRQAGFISVEVIHKRGAGSIRYVVVALFDGRAHADAWLASHELFEMRGALDRLAGAGRVVERFSGREIWFDETQAPRSAPYWKRVALSMICVLPAFQLVEWLIALPNFELPALARQVLATTILCAMLTWPIMPFAERLSSRWLRAG